MGGRRDHGLAGGSPTGVNDLCASNSLDGKTPFGGLNCLQFGSKKRRKQNERKLEGVYTTVSKERNLEGPASWPACQWRRGVNSCTQEASIEQPASPRR